MRIGSRLIINAVMMSLFSVLITSMAIGWVAYTQGQKSLKAKTQDQLISIRDIKKSEIEHYFMDSRNELSALASDQMVVDAMLNFKNAFKDYKEEFNKTKPITYNMAVIQQYMKEFSNAFHIKNGNNDALEGKILFNLSRESSFALQYNYILQNKNPIGSKDILDYVDDGTRYSQYHKKYHSAFRNFVKKLDYYDIFLVDAESGDVVYTVSKEADFTTSLQNGAFANTGLGKVFKAAVTETEIGMTAISDFSAYSPSYNGEAAFIAAPIYNGDQKIGVLIFQLSIDRINQIMTHDGHWQKIGLGKTGETYLVGHDYRLRSMSRFFIENPTEYIHLMKDIGLPEDVIHQMEMKKTSIGLQPVTTKGTQQAIETRQGGFGVFEDYRKIPVLSAFSPLSIPGLDWAIMSEIDASEAFDSVHSLAIKIMLLTAIVIFVMVFISILLGVKLSWKISKPMERISKVIKFISKDRDLTKRLIVSSDDELGDIAKAINDLFESLQKTFEETISSTVQVDEIAIELEELSHLLKKHSGNTLESDRDKIELEIEKATQLGKKGEELKGLSTKLKGLAEQFQILEAHSEETSEW